MLNKTYITSFISVSKHSKVTVKTIEVVKDYFPTIKKA